MSSKFTVCTSKPPLAVLKTSPDYSTYLETGRSLW